jgi:hypothetical protein
LQKLFPQEIRGTCNSILSIFKLIGSFLGSKYLDYLYQNPDGPPNSKLPFLGATGLDIFTAILIGFLSICGIFGNPINKNRESLISEHLS